MFELLRALNGWVVTIDGELAGGVFQSRTEAQGYLEWCKEEQAMAELAGQA